MQPAGYREYKKREFCNDVPCFVQVELNKHAANSENYETVRKICSSACQFKADDFENWLGKHGFSMFRNGEKVGFESVKENKQGKTTWEFHHWMTQNNLILAKKE